MLQPISMWLDLQNQKQWWLLNHIKSTLLTTFSSHSSWFRLIMIEMIMILYMIIEGQLQKVLWTIWHRSLISRSTKCCRFHLYSKNLLWVPLKPSSLVQPSICIQIQFGSIDYYTLSFMSDILCIYIIIWFSFLFWVSIDRSDTSDWPLIWNMS